MKNARVMKTGYSVPTWAMKYHDLMHEMEKMVADGRIDETGNDVLPLMKKAIKPVYRYLEERGPAWLTSS